MGMGIGYNSRPVDYSVRIQMHPFIGASSHWQLPMLDFRLVGSGHDVSLDSGEQGRFFLSGYPVNVESINHLCIFVR